MITVVSAAVYAVFSSFFHGSYDAGVFMGPTNIPFTSQAPTAFQGFPSMGIPVPAAPGLIGNVMGQSASMMVGMPMPMPNGFMGNAQTGVMPLPQNVIAPQGGMVGQMGTPQSKFGVPQTQQPQWNLSQVGVIYFPAYPECKKPDFSKWFYWYFKSSNLLERIE